MWPISNFLVATAVGLLIGLERERSKGEGPGRAPAGIRTFTIASLAGAVAMHLGGAMAVAVVVAALGALVAIAYFRERSGDPGLTTELALLAMPLVGALALSEPLLSGAIGVILTVLLAAKPALHQFARGTLTDEEVSDGLLFAVATVAVWPFLPDRPIGNFETLNLHTIWLVVILVLAIGGLGHVAARLFGQRFGLPVSGLVGGFVSSVATIGAMGGKAKESEGAMSAAVAGGTLSSVATFVQMVLVLAAVSLPTLRAVTPMLLAGGAAIALYGGFFAIKAARVEEGVLSTGRAFSLKAALLLALAMAGILVAMEWVNPWLGSRGITVAAAIGGVFDTHAAAMSVAAQVAAGKLEPGLSVVPILAAMTANAAMKISMAFASGGTAYALRISGGVVAYVAAIWGAALIFN